MPTPAWRLMWVLHKAAYSGCCLNLYFCPLVCPVSVMPHMSTLCKLNVSRSWAYLVMSEMMRALWVVMVNGLEVSSWLIRGFCSFKVSKSCCITLVWYCLRLVWRRSEISGCLDRLSKKECVVIGQFACLFLQAIVVWGDGTPLGALG